MNYTTNVMVFCHGRKDGENIAEEQIVEIVANGIPELNDMISGQKKVVVHLGSDFVYTEQTVFAFESYTKRVNLCEFDGYLPPDGRYGNEKLFTEFMTNPEIVAESKKTNWFEAFSKFNPTFIEKVQADMLDALTQDFNSVEPGTTVIMVGHTPMIEWLAFALDPQKVVPRNLQLKELTGFFFSRNDFSLKGAAKPSRQNRIYISGTIGF